MNTSFFITGTDTGIGKTHVMAQLIRQYHIKGLRVATLKPIATGVDPCNEDIMAYQAAGLPSEDCYTGWAFEPPVSPNIAARLANTRLSAEKIAAWCQQDCFTDYEVVLIEGAGGLMVPLNDQETWVDVLKILNIPVIVVIGIRLGCLNHALLTIHALQHAEIPIYGWIANHIDPTCLMPAEICATLKVHLKVPCLT